MNNRKVYALLTRKCNLTCPYCDVKGMEDNFNKDKFFNELRKFNGKIVLFGGEPTLYRDRLKDVLYSDIMIRKKISSMTTNLMILDDEMIKIFKDIGSIGTSWNPDRFRDNEYDTWVKHLNIIDGEITVRVLVTMTFDLLNMKPSDVINIISKWNNKTVTSIMFENLIDEKVDKEYFKHVDDWLCEIYDLWDLPMKFISNPGDEHIRCFDCSEVYHLAPDGTLNKGCPHTQHLYVPDKCYTCKLSGICSPCRLQKYCSVPINLHKKILESKR